MTHTRVAVEVVIRKLKVMLSSAHKTSIRRNLLTRGCQPGERIAAVVQGQAPGCAVWSATEIKRPPRVFRATFARYDSGQWPGDRVGRVKEKGNTRHAIEKGSSFD